MRKLLLALALVATPFGLAACGSSKSTSTDQASSGGADCTKANLALKTAGTLTFGTDNPAFSPWFGGGEKNKPWKFNDPSTGEGYESAVAYAVATKLGFGATEVKWAVTPFDKSFAPGPKDFDVFINQVSITPERAQNVDFSTGYYNVNQAVVGLADKPIGSATTIAELKSAKFGAQAGTTSLQAIKDKVAPSTDPAVYDTNDDAVKALRVGQIEGIVVDLPTGYFLTATNDGLKIVGQFAQTGAPEQFGMVLAKGSALTTCVSKAVSDLRTDGSLDKLEQQWLAGASAPFLK